MRYLSVCSGIEAASVAWHPLGWEPIGFAEIEPFPSAVLAHRFPNVPNHGDMTKFKEWGIEPGTIDVLVGGTPCQSFSVAGLRRGLADPRGNLMLTFGAIADHFKPTFIVWENVPGVLSTNGGDDFRSFLDMLEYIGYVVDVDIHDAQFHGVPQRRRRVFICGRRSEDILNKRTNTSSLIIIQLLQEISLTILTVALHQSGNAPQSSDKLNRLNDGLERRMKLFGLVGEKDNSTMLQENLIDVFLKHLQELKSSDVSRGEYEKALILEGQLTDSQAGSQYTLTAQSLSEVLDESLKVAKSYITSTATKTITTSEIYLFSKLVLLTGKLIVLSNKSSPSLWSAASSSLTSLREYINYARQTTSDLFGDLERIHCWDDFIGEAIRLQEVIGSIGVEDFGKILPITESLCWNTPPSREARKDVTEIAGTLAANGDRTTRPAGNCNELDFCIPMRSHWEGNYPHPTLNQSAKGTGGVGASNQELFSQRGAYLVPAIMAHGQANAEIRTDGGAPALTCNHEAPIVSYGIPGNWIGRKPENGGNATEPMHDIAPCLTKTDIHGVAHTAHTLRGRGFDASEDGTGRGTPIVPVAFDMRGREGGAQFEGPNDTANIRAANGGSSRSYVAFAQNTRDEVREMSVVGALAAQPGMKQQSYIRESTTVRRLTPRECERLQGFPDDWTKIPWRGATAENCPDGPRYKACGNSMAVPVMRWIGERIEMVEAMVAERNDR
jgi:DNA-cytosine methyltransferase